MSRSILTEGDDDMAGGERQTRRTKVAERAVLEVDVVWNRIAVSEIKRVQQYQVIDHYHAPRPK